MSFEGALITERGITFGVLCVQPHVLNHRREAKRTRRFGQRAWDRVPVVLLAQDASGRPPYAGPYDLARFLAVIDIRRIPFRRWNLRAAA